MSNRKKNLARKLINLASIFSLAKARVHVVDINGDVHAVSSGDGESFSMPECAPRLLYFTGLTDGKAVTEDLVGKYLAGSLLLSRTDGLANMSRTPSGFLADIGRIVDSVSREAADAGGAAIRMRSGTYFKSLVEKAMLRKGANPPLFSAATGHATFSDRDPLGSKFYNAVVASREAPGLDSRYYSLSSISNLRRLAAVLAALEAPLLVTAVHGICSSSFDYDERNTVMDVSAAALRDVAGASETDPERAFLERANRVEALVGGPSAIVNVVSLFRSTGGQGLLRAVSEQHKPDPGAFRIDWIVATTEMEGAEFIGGSPVSERLHRFGKELCDG